MPSSDSSSLAAASYGVVPSCSCRVRTTRLAATSRSPGSRAGDVYELAKLLRPREPCCSTPALVAATPWPSSAGDGLGDSDRSFGVRSPGLFAWPPTLRFMGHPMPRKGWPSRGRTPPGVGLARSVDVDSSCSPTFSCRFVPAHPPPDACGVDLPRVRGRR